MAKEYFKEHNVPYVEHDVLASPEKRQEMVDISGQLGVPVIVIGRDVTVGFNQPKIAELLGINN